MLVYTEEKKFTKEQVQQLFLSVNWISGNYPERLYKALMNSSTVFTVWDADKLVGLTRVLDDTELLAQIHYVLVHPDYQGYGIGSILINNILDYIKSHSYAGLNVACSLYANIGKEAFYEKFGFKKLPNSKYGYGMLIEV